MKTTKTRLMFDFQDRLSAARFLESVKPMMPEEVGAYEADSLDFSAGSGGITTGNSFVVRATATADRDGRRRMVVSEEREV